MVTLASAIVSTTEVAAESSSNGLAALGVNWSVLIAQIVNFLILLVVLRWVLYRPILKLLAERRRTISEGLAAAEAQKKALADFAIERDKLLAQAREEAQALLTKTREEIKAEKEAFRAELKAERQRSDERARLAAEAIRAQMLTSARRQLADLVVTATSKLLQEPSAQITLTKSAVEQILKELS